ncbi:putative endonuclease lcl3 [Actinomortierella wolfii]|nr:putative endonuclease lcl3 [Actinomortierella wolfii]
MVWPFRSGNTTDKDGQDAKKEKPVLSELVSESATNAIAQANQMMDETVRKTMKTGLNVEGDDLLGFVPASMRPYVTAVGLFGALTIASMVYRRRLRWIQNSAYLTPDMLQGRRLLRGKVTSVGDADNFRFYHTPGGIWAGWGWLRHVPKRNNELKGNTIHVRLAGVDAPEAAHFGHPAQPFSKEALEWLRKQVLGKTVYIMPYSRDRYDRVVSMAWAPRFLPFLPKKNVSLEMLKVGLGQIYKQAGAEYGGSLAQFEKAEAKARARKIGIWSQKDMVSAAEHKRRYFRNGDK